MFFLLLALLPGFAVAGENAYENALSVEAARALEKIAGRSPEKLSEVELKEWAEARLAWISLRRLQGREKEAIEIFQGCGTVCGKYGAAEEWQATKEWGCQKKREANPCLSSTAKPDKAPDKTKAQKPPR